METAHFYKKKKYFSILRYMKIGVFYKFYFRVKYLFLFPQKIPKIAALQKFLTLTDDFDLVDS